MLCRNIAARRRARAPDAIPPRCSARPPTPLHAVNLSPGRRRPL
ncbi:hypothetical protein BURPS1106B_1515 [Burkholderia pseudomallei 1106b]|nr:hypothetical protein BUH_4769 [Burkholderia pseudomallei Pakistan 9]EES22096.1 hypothetical protein BURPS1106B_1515 [Burkholderia pseudomallei 1106b]